MSDEHVESSSPQMQQQDMNKIIREFIPDLFNTFPELKDDVHEGIIDILQEDYETGSVKSLQDHVKERLPKHFFDILYQNDEVFSNGENNCEFIPGIDFAKLWKEDISDNTRSVIWKYLQLLLFSVVNDIEDTDAFGDTAKLFEAIDANEFKSKLEETMSSMETFFEDMSGVEDGGDGESKKRDISGVLPNAEEMHNHINSMLGGKLGELAQEIAEETATELGIDLESVDNNENKQAMDSVFKKLLRNPQKLMGLVDKIGKKLKNKVESGELKQSELMEEAMTMMQKMKDMPGMGNIKQMMSKMGVNPGSLGKMNMGAMTSALQQNISQSKTRERLQAKLAQRKAAAANSSQSTGVLTVNDNNEKVFTTGELVEKSTRGDKPRPKKNKKKRKAKNKK